MALRLPIRCLSISAKLLCRLGAGNCQGPHDKILSDYFGGDTICIAILRNPYVLEFDTVILLRFGVPNILLTICLLHRDKREP